MRGGRRWLEEILWSERSPAQASGSLRRTLTELRSIFSGDPEVLRSNRLEIWLDPERIDTDLDIASKPRMLNREFLADLDVREAQFDEWKNYMAERLASARVPAHERAQGDTSLDTLKIRSAKSDVGTSVEHITGQIIADQVAKGVEERLSTILLPSERSRMRAGPDIEIRCKVADDGQRSCLFLRIESVHDGRVLYSCSRSIESGSSDFISAEFVAELVNSVAFQLVRRLPGRKLTQYDPKFFGDTGSSRLAYQFEYNDVYLAWRALIRLNQLSDDLGGKQLPGLGRVSELKGNHLLEKKGNTDLETALLGLTQFMLVDDLHTSQVKASAYQVIRGHQDNLFEKQTLAVAHSLMGNTEKAYELSTACRASSYDNVLGPLRNLYHALVCLSAGHFKEARQTAYSARMALDYIAPSRPLVALMAASGVFENSLISLQQINEMEPDLALDFYLDELNYSALENVNVWQAPAISQRGQLALNVYQNVVPVARIKHSNVEPSEESPRFRQEFRSEHFIEKFEEIWGDAPIGNLCVELAEKILKLPLNKSQEITIEDIGKLVGRAETEAELFSAITALSSSSLPLLDVGGKYIGDLGTWTLTKEEFDAVLNHDTLFDRDTGEKIASPQKNVVAIFSVRQKDDLLDDINSLEIENYF